MQRHNHLASPKFQILHQIILTSKYDYDINEGKHQIVFQGNWILLLRRMCMSCSAGYHIGSESSKVVLEPLLRLYVQRAELELGRHRKGRVEEDLWKGREESSQGDDVMLGNHQA